MPTPARKLSTESISTAESERLRECEQVIERGLTTFVEVGTALTEINKSRLYRADYGTFEDYCRERWHMSRARAYQMIEAASVVGDLSTTVDIPAPASERQVRELAAVPAEKRADVWREAVETAPKDDAGKPKVTAAHVARVVRPSEPEPESHEPDMADELAHADKQIRELEALVESLSKDDLAREVRAWSAKYAQLEARLNQAITTSNVARQQAESYDKKLKAIAKLVGVQKYSDIIPAIEARQKAA